ncbi:MAG: secondary thiamine-phosphate synthase enzyme YjbQ [Anaeromassilibacillus sp.]
MVKHYQFSVLTDDEYSYHYIGEQVKAYVKESGITSGIVTTVVAHTNCGIVVTEPLECIMDDFKVLLHKLVDDDAQYAHEHFLPTYGRTSANAYGHLRSLLTGNSCIFPIQNGSMIMGAAQEIVLMEFDGPQERTVFVDVIGE